ncbi:MAG: AMP-binding protein, partial [Myxococcota bacterium]|nr:AMP-binding protein [Myxococcota bacterium]
MATSSSAAEEGAGVALDSNIAAHLPRMAQLHPEKRAMSLPAGTGPEGKLLWTHLSFAELDSLSNSYAQGLERVGIARGVRTILMVKPSVEFFALVFALFKIGAVVVMIDPGMGKRSLKQCLREVEPEAFIGVPLAQVARLVFRSSLRSVHTVVTVGPRWFWGGHRLRNLIDPEPAAWTMAETQPEEVAAILFTSGSTGVPKGAVYTHGMFDAQVRMLRSMYGFGADEIDLPTFPLFALFDPALGMTAVIPDMDARKPGSADPAKLVDAIEAHGCTNMFGSPALLRNLGRYGLEQGVRLPSLRRVLSAGAPARLDVLEAVSGMLSD